MKLWHWGLYALGAFASVAIIIFAIRTFGGATGKSLLNSIIGTN